MRNFRRATILERNRRKIKSTAVPATLKNRRHIYTEDHLPVHNISIDKMSKNIKKSYIVKYFGKFGPIKQVKIMYGRTRSHSKKCIVCFKNPIAAATALQQTLHKINNEKLTVKPCPSWEQPFDIRSIGTKEDYPSILTLNDYCLEIIYMKLSLREQIRLSLCHERLESIFNRMICPRVIKMFSFELIRGFTLWEIRQLFKTAGQFMQSFEISRIDCLSTMKHEGTIYEFMEDYCKFVNHLQIIRRRFIFTNFLNVLNVKNITEVEMYDCDLYEGELAHLRVLKNLITLGLGRNRNLVGIKIPALKKVQNLSLYGCQKISQANLIEICKSLQLRFLDVRCMDDIRNWNCIVDHCKTLETLKMSRIDCDGREGAECIASLPKLKKLEMQFFVRAMPSSFYDTLVKNHADDLEELKITGSIYALFPNVAANIVKFKCLSVLWLGDSEYNSSKDFLNLISGMTELQEINLNYSARIKGDHLLPLLKCCTKLKRIGLRYCKHITSDFIFKAIAVLDKLTNFKAPILMLVGGTHIKKSILKDPRYLNAKHLIHLSFHLNTAEFGYIVEKNEFSLIAGDANDENSANSAVDDETTDSDVDDGDTDDLNAYWLSDDSSGDELEVFFMFLPLLNRIL